MGHAEALAALGLAGPEAGRLAAYLELLAVWGRRVNLTAAHTPEERVRILVAPVVPLARRLAPGPLLDIGSGNGSPGLVLGLLRPELPVTLLEPRARRWAFLLEAARAAGRPDVTVLRLRHDAYPGPAATSVTLRGLALPLASLAALVAPGGRVFVWGAAPQPQPPFLAEAESDGVRSYLREA